MKAKLVSQLLVLPVLVMVLTGCETTMEKKDWGTIAGAVGGAVVGSALGGNSGVAQRNSMIVGAALGAYAGRQFGAYFDDQEKAQIRAAQERALENARLIEQPVHSHSGAVYAVEAIKPLDPASVQSGQPALRQEAPAAVTTQVKANERPSSDPFADLDPDAESQPTRKSEKRHKSIKASITTSSGIQPTAMTSVAPQPGECRTVVQRVTLPDGKIVKDSVNFCKQPPSPGRWVQIS